MALVAAVNVLAVNVGGITLALSMIDSGGHRIGETVVDPWDGVDTGPVERFVSEHPAPDAVGHRVVHGGSIDQPVVIDEGVIGALTGAGAFAPIHQPRALAGLSAARAALPDLPHVACFDTTFHRTLPDTATTYALPASWRRWPLQRRGFHGLSHSYVARTAPSVLAGRPGPRPRRIVSCHLGSGGSVCAILDGVSVDTTMGATPLEGLVMAHRSGSVDPGIILWLLEHGGLSVGEVADGLRHHGGLAALAGGSGDMRDILARRADGDPSASLAFDVYIHRLRSAIGAMAASLAGVDLLAFTGGIGEHLPEVRRAATAGLGFLGIEIVEADLDTTETGPLSTAGDRDVTAPDASAGCVVVATGEDHAIAITTRTVLLASTGTMAPEPGTV